VHDAGSGGFDATLAMEPVARRCWSTPRSPDLTIRAGWRGVRAAVEGGRLARLAGRIPKRLFAEPSSPQLGLVGS
jgi:thiazole synthase